MIEQICIKKNEQGIQRLYSLRNSPSTCQFQNFQRFNSQNHKQKANSLIKINNSKLPKDFFSKKSSEKAFERKVSLSQDFSRKELFTNDSTYSRITPKSLKKDSLSKLQYKMAQNLFKMSNISNVIGTNIHQDIFIQENILNMNPFRKFNKIVQNANSQILRFMATNKDPSCLKISMSSLKNINIQHQQQIYSVRLPSEKQNRQNKCIKKMSFHSESQEKHSLLIESSQCQNITFYKAKSSILPPIRNANTQKTSTDN